MIGSGSMAAYRAAGAFNDEYDPPDEPERRTRCSCGAFLPSTPTWEGGVFKEPRDYGYERPDTREWVPDVVDVEEYYEPTTKCKRCGRDWTEGELWT
jgi:hypothetical protein